MKFACVMVCVIVKVNGPSRPSNDVIIELSEIHMSWFVLL